MATDLERLLVTLDADITKFARQLAIANGQANKQAGAIQKRFNDMNSGIGKQFDDLGKRFVAAFAAGVSISAAKSLIDSSVKIENQLKSTGLAGGDLQKVYDSLFASAQKNAAPLEALATLYTRASSAAADLKAGQSDLVKFVDGVSLALRVSGQSAEESAGALLQLGQALGDGKIQAEEYNSLLDGGRSILQSVANGLQDAGGSVGKLTKLVKDGKVSSEAFFRAFLAGAPSLEKAVADADTTVSASMTRIQNALIDAAGKFNESTKASELFGRVASEVAVEVGQINFDALITQIQGIIKVLAEGGAALANFEAGWLNTIGKLSGAQGLANKLVGLLPGDTTDKDLLAPLGLPGAFVIHPLDNEQNRINDAFGLPDTSSGGPTAAQMQAYAQQHGLVLSPKTSRLPTSASTVKLSDFPVTDSASKGGKSRTDDYQREVESIKDRTAALQSAYTAQAALNPLVDDYGYAVAKAKAQQDLLTAAQKAGKEVTPELKAQIDQLAEKYADATAAGEKLKETQDRIRESLQQSADLGKDVFGGIVQDLRDGASAGTIFQDVLNKILDKIIEMNIDWLFDGNKAGSGGGILGGLFSPLLGAFTPSSTGGGVVSAASAVSAAQTPLRVPDASAFARPMPQSSTIRMHVDVSGARGNQEIVDMVETGVRKGIDHNNKTRAPAIAVAAVREAQLRA